MKKPIATAILLALFSTTHAQDSTLITDHSKSLEVNASLFSSVSWPTHKPPSLGIFLAPEIRFSQFSEDYVALGWNPVRGSVYMTLEKKFLGTKQFNLCVFTIGTLFYEKGDFDPFGYNTLGLSFHFDEGKKSLIVGTVLAGAPRSFPYPVFSLKITTGWKKTWGKT